MSKLIKWVLFGIMIGCTIFTVVGIVFDIANKGTYILTGWSYTEMAFGGMLISIGFAVPANVYENEKLHPAVKVLIHMGIGCSVMLAVAFAVGWISLENGWLTCALTVAGYLLSSFVIWLAVSCYFKNEAKRLNEKIREKQKEA